MNDVVIVVGHIAGKEFGVLEKGNQAKSLNKLQLMERMMERILEALQTEKWRETCGRRWEKLLA